jgi:hypothetical protein
VTIHENFYETIKDVSHTFSWDERGRKYEESDILFILSFLVQFSLWPKRGNSPGGLSWGYKQGEGTSAKRGKTG